MTLPEFWDRCYGFNWRSYDLGGGAISELQKAAKFYGPEYELMLNRFSKAHRFENIPIPPRPDAEIRHSTVYKQMRTDYVSMGMLGNSSMVNEQRRFAEQQQSVDRQHMRNMGMAGLLGAAAAPGPYESLPMNAKLAAAKRWLAERNMGIKK